MSLAVIDKELESYGRNHYKKGAMERFQKSAGSQLEKIFRRIRGYLEPKQKLELNLRDCGLDYKSSLTKENVTITSKNGFTEVVSWGSYLQQIKNSFPHEVLIASKELKKLEKSNTKIYQEIK